MNAGEVSSKIKQIIGSIAGIDPQHIGDDATLRGELSLDSLSLLEIGVDVDIAFQLNLPDEAYKEIESLPAMVTLVVSRQAELAAVDLADRRAQASAAAAPAADPAPPAEPADPASRAAKSPRALAG